MCIVSVWDSYGEMWSATALLYSTAIASTFAALLISLGYHSSVGFRDEPPGGLSAETVNVASIGDLVGFESTVMDTYSGSVACKFKPDGNEMQSRRQLTCPKRDGTNVRRMPETCARTKSRKTSTS